MKTLLLLHGAIGADDQLQPLAQVLAAHYNVHTLSFSGHGGVAPHAEGYSIRVFANDVLDYMQLNGLEQASILGYSMGGYVALYLAAHCPEKIESVMTLATKFQWTEEIAAKEVKMLVPEKIEEKLPAFAATLSQRHAPLNWKDVLHATAAMMRDLGEMPVLTEEVYARIAAPCMLLLGDRDKMVLLEETVAVYKSLPNAQMAVLPGTAHPIEQVDITLLDFFARRFFGQ
jgi:pimeloyl-ACP methyl ester carboxylesterase